MANTEKRNAKRTAKGPYGNLGPYTEGPLGDSKVKSQEFGGAGELVDALALATKAKEKSEEKIGKLRLQLDPLAAQKRRDLERKGIFTKTIIFLGAKLNACYTFKDSYRTIDVGLEDKLKMVLGNVYDLFFTRKREWTVREGMMEKLLEKLGDKAPDYLEQKEWLEPVENFREMIFDVRKNLDHDQKETLDSLLGQIASKPSLSMK